MPRGEWKNRPTLSRKITAGKSFGRLSATGIVELRDRIGRKRQSREPWFECKCSCGVVKLYPGYALTAGRIKSCGCLISDQMRKKFKERKEREGSVPVEGDKFGNLSVIIGSIYYREGKSKIYCQCTCGQKVWRELFYLRRGNYTSCGNPYCKTSNRSTEDIRLDFLFKDCLEKAISRELTFDLTKAEFLELIDGDCHYCGSTQSNTRKRYRKLIGDLEFTYNGIDRIDSDGGYFTNNCVSCCGSCNKAKMASPYDDFILRCNRIASLHPRNTTERSSEMSFFDKLNTLAKGSAHDLLDRVINENSPTMVRQYVRDLEEGINQIKTNAALSDGQLRTAIRERSELASKVETDKATITKLLASADPKGPTLAKDKGAVVVQNQSRLKAMDDSITVQQQIVDKTNQTISALQTKHELMVSRVRELERLDRDTKAKESAATAITNAGKLAGVADNAGVDDLEDRMRRRNDVASAKFDSAMGDIHVEQPDNDEVNALLESLKPQEAVAAK